MARRHPKATFQRKYQPWSAKRVIENITGLHTEAPNRLSKENTNHGTPNVSSNIVQKEKTNQ